MQDVVGIILAAGRSSRMGAFKPLLPFGNTTVVESCIRSLRSGGVASVMVVLGHRAEDLKAHLSTSDVLFAVNSNENGDMSSSVSCAARQLPKEAKAVVITPVDYPAVPPEVVSTLIDKWKEGHLLVKPTWEGRGGHPVVVDLVLRDELLNLNPDLGLKTVFDSHSNQVSRVPVGSNYIARDIDTWDDYASLHLEVFGSLPVKRNLEPA